MSMCAYTTHLSAASRRAINIGYVQNQASDQSNKPDLIKFVQSQIRAK